MSGRKKHMQRSHRNHDGSTYKHYVTGKYRYKYEPGKIMGLLNRIKDRFRKRSEQ